MMHLMKSNNYKNTVKGLRKLTSSKTTEESAKAIKKNFSFLENVDCENVDQYFESSNELTLQKSREKNDIVFNDLPEDTVYIILGFLSFNTRVAILKNKYNKNYIKNKLEKIPQTLKGMNQMWKCAEIATELLKSLIENQSDVFYNFSTYSVIAFEKDKTNKLYTWHYRENFIKIILAAIHHYTKIYKFSYYTNKKVVEHIEKIILNIFAHLSEMK